MAGMGATQYTILIGDEDNVEAEEDGLAAYSERPEAG